MGTPIQGLNEEGSLIWQRELDSYAYQVTDRTKYPYTIHDLIDTTLRKPTSEFGLSALISRIDTGFSLCLDIRTISKVGWRTSSQPPCKYLEERYMIWLSAEDLKNTEVLRLHYTNWQEDEYYSCDSIGKRWGK